MLKPPLAKRDTQSDHLGDLFMEFGRDHTRNRRRFYFALSSKDLHPKCSFVIVEHGLQNPAVIPDKDLLV